MEQSLDNKAKLKDKLVSFYKSNKIKIYIFTVLLIISIISLIFINYSTNKKNILISEKYIEAGIYLNLNKKDDAKLIYEEIIMSKNKFYSILALNTVIEKELITDTNKILKYFEVLKKSISQKDQLDLLTLKEALYLINASKTQRGHDLLKKLIDKNSPQKSIAEELINK